MSGLDAAAALATIALISLLYLWRDRRWSVVPLNAVILIGGVAIGVATPSSFWAGYFGAVLGAHVLAFFITRPADIASWGRERGSDAPDGQPSSDRVAAAFVAATAAAAAIIAVGVAVDVDTIANAGRLLGIAAMTGCAVLTWSRAGEARARP